jgi:TRAP-type C4-dicarboxylate transport system permease small subunit
MSERPNKTRHLIAVALVVAGVLILAGLVGFVVIAVGFRQSFTATFTPFEDTASGLIVLSPIVIFALLLIGYGRSLLRKE